MIFYPFILTRVNSSQDLCKNNWQDWIKQLFFYLNGDAGQMGLLDYLPVPIFGMVKCIQHYLPVKLKLFTWLLVEFVCLPKNFVALVMSLIASPFFYFFDKSKPRRQDLAELLLQMKGTVLPELDYIRPSELTLADREKLFDSNQLPLSQLIDDKGLGNLVRTYFLYIYIAFENTGEKRYFITINPSPAFMGLHGFGTLNPIKFSKDFDVFLTWATIFLELNAHNVNIIRKIGIDPSPLYQQITGHADIHLAHSIENASSFSKNGLSFLVPEVHTGGSSQRTKLQRIPLSLIIPHASAPAEIKSRIGIGRYIGGESASVISKRLCPKYWTDQMPDKKRLKLFKVLLTTLLVTSQPLAESKHDNPNNTDDKEQSANSLMQQYRSFGFFLVSEHKSQSNNKNSWHCLLTPLNRKHAEQIQSITMSP